MIGSDVSKWRMQVNNGMEEEVASLKQNNAQLSCEVQQLRDQMKVMLVMLCRAVLVIPFCR